MNLEATMHPLNAQFYNRHPIVVAEQLLGKTIFRKDGRDSLKAVIIDTEAYGPFDEDAASRAEGHRALRNWEPGLAWTTYYMWGKPTFEVTTKGSGSVLVRGVLLESTEGGHRTIRGPISVAVALHIDRSVNGVDLTQAYFISINEDANVVVHSLQSSCRINLRFADKESRRFFVRFKDLEIRRVVC